ncbi:hypothetical protein RBSWK_02891 [Rhodopirellula baltica SWK14]|uniref:Uncharacterized protein n=1 Tax=Rhodopirellula baltica SWK14 TaxID=993516 RepID=L7CGT5_RHOBT|nr:hypothetical protein RBSWK_02891 [Rhodopirellula baltica SWK14]
MPTWEPAKRIRRQRIQTNHCLATETAEAQRWLTWLAFGAFGNTEIGNDCVGFLFAANVM